MKELKTKEDFEAASMAMLGCALVVIPFAMLVFSIAVGFIFGAGFGFLAFFCCLMAACVWFILVAKLNMRKAKKAAEKEQDDD